jgi:acyl-CoA thioesterase-1
VRNFFFIIVAASIPLYVGCGTSETVTPKQRPRQEASAAPPTAAVDNRPMVVAFGDSLSAGFGAEPGKSFPDYIQKMIDQKGLGWRIYNAGVSGDTTSDGVERLPEVLALHPKIVIVEFGGNDGLRGLPVTTTKANLARIIEAFQTAGTRVLLAGMTLPRNYGPEYIASFEKVYVDLAEQYKIPRIPFLLEGVGGVRRLMQQDGIHPTGEGNAIVAKTVFRYLQPMLTERG